MKKVKVTVSVLMSVYNTNTEYLCEAIDSVLNQTFTDFEFLITDDCSDEMTKKVLYDYANKDQRVRIITNSENKGLTKNLNRMIGEAKGKYLARMDADDICFPNRFLKQVEYLDEHPEIAVLGTWFNIIKDSTVIGYKKEAFLPYQMKARLFFHNSGNLHSSMMMRREVINVENNLLYDITMKKTQDYDLWVRVTEKYKILLLPQILMSYRISDGQISSAGSASQLAYRDRVILSQLNKLIDEPSIEEQKIHLSYCTGGNEFPSSSYLQWGERIVKSNHQRKCYDDRAFDYYAYTLMIRGILRSQRRKLPLSFCKIILLYAFYAARFYASWGWNVMNGQL